MFTIGMGLMNIIIRNDLQVICTCNHVRAAVIVLWFKTMHFELLSKPSLFDVGD